MKNINLTNTYSLYRFFEWPTSKTYPDTQKSMQFNGLIQIRNSAELMLRYLYATTTTNQFATSFVRRVIPVNYFFCSSDGLFFPFKSLLKVITDTKKRNIRNSEDNFPNHFVRIQPCKTCQCLGNSQRLRNFSRHFQRHLNSRIVFFNAHFIGLYLRLWSNDRTTFVFHYFLCLISEKEYFFQ